MTPEDICELADVINADMIIGVDPEAELLRVLADVVTAAKEMLAYIEGDDCSDPEYVGLIKEWADPLARLDGLKA